MALADLIVLNRNTSGDTSTTLLPDACVIGTCLREVRIGMLTPEDRPLPVEADAAGYELHAGAEAYRFLLQLAFLASDAANFITGQSFSVNGGNTLA